MPSKFLLKDYTGTGEVVYDADTPYMVGKDSITSMNSFQKLVITYDDVSYGDKLPAIFMKELLSGIWSISRSFAPITLTNDIYGKTKDPQGNDKYSICVDLTNLRSGTSIDARVFLPSGSAITNLNIIYAVV